MTSYRSSLAAALTTCAVLLLPAAAAHGGERPIALKVGAARFWDGPTIEGGNVTAPDLCGVQAPCPTYALLLKGGGRRLRVALDTPMRDDTFQLDVIGPDGKTAATATNSNQFNDEAYVANPVPGPWTVRVMPKGVTRARLRLRAKLEGPQPRAPEGKVPILPNLKSVPPLEFGFVAPANPLNGLYPPDTANPPLEAAGQHPVSCAADEAAPKEVGGFEAKRCLRLTSGPINVGPGIYDMRFAFAEDVSRGEGQLQPDGGTIQRGPSFQAVHFADGSIELREAGTYSFHLTHGHFHDDGVLTYELFAVHGRRRPRLVKAGDGTKSGFCPADQLFGEWRRFSQAPAGSFGEGDSAGGNCFSPTDGRLGLSIGWGDVYRWQRPGQYVEFEGNDDGRYVVRTTVDKGNDTLETNERDNSAYALIRVTGDRVQILERGQGQSPWDRRKVVFTGAGPASQD